MHNKRIVGVGSRQRNTMVWVRWPIKQLCKQRPLELVWLWQTAIVVFETLSDIVEIIFRNRKRRDTDFRATSSFLVNWQPGCELLTLIHTKWWRQKQKYFLFTLISTFSETALKLSHFCSLMYPRNIPEMRPVQRPDMALALVSICR